MTHTPGPWVVKFNTDNQTAAIEPSKELLAQGRGGIAHIYKKNPLDEGYANQRLIAAAPDLLAALEQLVERVDWLAQIDANPDWQPIDNTPMRPAKATDIDYARDAIAKARGQQ